jgi:hypothetical protein
MQRPKDASGHVSKWSNLALLAFVEKYYEYGGDLDIEDRGLTIGGYESAWRRVSSLYYVFKLCELLRGWGFSHSFFHVCNNAKWVLIPTFFYDIPFSDTNILFMTFLFVTLTLLLFIMFLILSLLLLCFQIVWITAFVMFSNCVDYCVVEAFHIFLFTFFYCFHLPSLIILRLFTFFDCLPTRALMCGLLRGWGFSHFSIAYRQD